MAWIALDSVTDALLLCGTYSPGRAPSAAIGQVALSFLNQIRAALNGTKGLTCYGSNTLTATVDGGTSYTFGTGGDNATRPVGIMSAQYEDGGGTVWPLSEIPFAEYQASSNKATPGTPCYYAIDGAFPTLAVYVYPAPTTGTLRLVVRTPFSEIANLSDAMPDPPAYRQYFKYALACELGRIPGLGAVPEGGEGMAATLLNDLQTTNIAHNIPSKFMPYAYRVNHGFNDTYWWP
jgi:hypothetical protein